MVLLVSSYDRMFDSWLPFFALLKKFWPDCPYRMCVITNHVRFDPGAIEAITLGADAGWGTNLLSAMERAGDEHVFYFQEDHFLLRPIDQAKISADFDCLKSGGFDTLTYRAKSLRRSPGATLFPGREELMVHPPDSLTGVYCDPSMWRTEALRGTVRSGESAWDFLKHGRERAAAAGLQRLHYRSEKLSRVPIHYFKRSGIREGLWKADALWWLIKQRAPLWPPQRGIALSSIKLAKRVAKEPKSRGVQLAGRALALLKPLEDWEKRLGERRLDRTLERYRDRPYPINALLKEWEASQG